MQLPEFQKLALRTESHIDNIKVNRENLAHLLRVVVGVTEVLDGLKKAVFYNKTAKLDEKTGDLLQQIGRSTAAVAWNLKGYNEASEGIQDVDIPLDNIDPRMFHGLLGIITESGELAAALLKAVEDSTATIDAVNVQEEMSDIAWYEAIIHDSTGLDWGQGLHNVIEKLKIRYPDKFSDWNADNRDLAAERAALEVGTRLVDQRDVVERFKLGDHATVIEGSGGAYINLKTGEYKVTEHGQVFSGTLNEANRLELEANRVPTTEDLVKHYGNFDDHVRNAEREVGLERVVEPFNSLYNITLDKVTCACGVNPYCECGEN